MKKWKSLFLLFLSGVIASCQSYKNQFDCPPGEGVPCTSVSELEKMIIESDEGGPDIFSGKKLNSEDTTGCCNKSQRNMPISGKKLWINDFPNSPEVGCRGQYIYFPD